MLKRARLAGLIGVLLMLSYTDMNMASSLILPAATDLNGPWTVHDEKNSVSCALQLEATASPEASGYVLSGDTQCIRRWSTDIPQAWRPLPDGIALLDEEGLTLLLFEKQADGYRTGVTADKSQLLLKRSL